MRVHATWPCGVLEVNGPRISLRTRWFGRFFDPVDLVVSRPDDLREVYMLVELLGTGLGLGFRDNTDRDFYFWPLGSGNKTRCVLESLRSHGYQVGDVPRRAEKRWRGVP